MRLNMQQKEQGHILGAFFYGYILFQIPGARMAEQIGAKWLVVIKLGSNGDRLGTAILESN